MKTKPQAPSLQGSGTVNGNEPVINVMHDPHREFICDGCRKPIEGQYASFGGNIVPYISPKQYHLGCIPRLRDLIVYHTRGIAGGSAIGAALERNRASGTSEHLGYFCVNPKREGVIMKAKRAPKPKFREGMMVKLLDREDGDYIVELIGRDKLPGIWEWRIKGFAIGTAPEHLMRPLTTQERREQADE